MFLKAHGVDWSSSTFLLVQSRRDASAATADDAPFVKTYATLGYL